MFWSHEERFDSWFRRGALTALGMGLLLAAGPALAGLEGPAIRFEYREVELGNMPQHLERDTVFVFENVGDEDLHILDVKTSCGCTAALSSDEVIKPGGRGTINVTFNSKSFRGHVSKTVTVTSNDPGEPRSHLKLFADVQPTINYSPSLISMGIIRRTDKQTHTVRLAAEKSKHLEITDLKLSDEYFTWTRREEANPESTVYVYEITLRDDAPLGRMSEHFTAYTNLEESKPITVSIRGEIVNHFLAKPSLVNFGSIQRGKAEPRTVIVRPLEDTHFEVKGVQSTHPQIQTRLEDAGEGSYKIILDIGPDVVAGPLKARILIKTTDPDEPVLTVPIQGYVRGEG